MHRIIEDVRENVSNPRGQKRKCTEIKKTEEKFTEIKKTGEHALNSRGQ
jgi:hypothetical protein